MAHFQPTYSRKAKKIQAETVNNTPSVVTTLSINNLSINEKYRRGNLSKPNSCIGKNTKLTPQKREKKKHCFKKLTTSE